MSFKVITDFITKHLRGREAALMNRYRARWSTADVSTWDAYWKALSTQADNDAFVTQYNAYLGNTTGDIAKLQGAGIKVAFGASVRRDIALQFPEDIETSLARNAFSHSIGCRYRLEQLIRAIKQKDAGFSQT